MKFMLRLKNNFFFYISMKNPLVFWLSLLALGFIVLAVWIDWLFLIGAIIIMIYNQKELIKNSPIKSN